MSFPGISAPVMERYVVAAGAAAGGAGMGAFASAWLVAADCVLATALDMAAVDDCGRVP